MSGNFGFLEEREKLMARLSRQAEDYVYSDPQSCLFKLRLMVETMAKRLVEMHMPEAVSEDLAVMLSRLERIGTIDRTRADTMHAVRRDGNAAVHGGQTPVPTAMRRLREMHTISKWFVQQTDREGRKVRAGAFVTPPKPAGMGPAARAALQRAEELEERIEEERRRTRRALMLYNEEDNAEHDAERLRGEIESLNRVAVEAGEPLLEADSVRLIMAMEVEQLLEHPSLGMTSRDAKREAERQFEQAKRELDERERRYSDQRSAIADEIELD